MKPERFMPVKDCPYRFDNGNCYAGGCCAGGHDFDTCIWWLRKEVERLHEANMALMNELYGICWACKNQKPWGMSVTGKTVACEHLAGRGIMAAGGRAGKNCGHWEWRGMEKAR